MAYDRRRSSFSDRATRTSPNPSFGKLGHKRKYGPTPRTINRYLAGLGLTLVVIMLSAPFALLPLLGFSVIISIWRKLKGWTHLASGVIYFILAWLSAATALLPTADGRTLAQHPPSTAAGLLLFGICLLMIPFLWRPARACSRQLLEEGRGLAAGITTATALSAAGLSIILSLYVALISL